MEEELSQRQDGKLSFKSWLCFAEQAYEKELGMVESSEGWTCLVHEALEFALELDSFGIT